MTPERIAELRALAKNIREPFPLGAVRDLLDELDRLERERDVTVASVGLLREALTRTLEALPQDVRSTTVWDEDDGEIFEHAWGKPTAYRDIEKLANATRLDRIVSLAAVKPRSGAGVSASPGFEYHDVPVRGDRGGR